MILEQHFVNGIDQSRECIEGPSLNPFSLKQKQYYKTHTRPIFNSGKQFDFAKYKRREANTLAPEQIKQGVASFIYTMLTVRHFPLRPKQV